MSDALEKHDQKVSKDGQNITRFADFIDALAEEGQKIEVLAESRDKACTMFKMEISVKKDQTDAKQCLWHPKGDQGKRAEAGYR